MTVRPEFLQRVLSGAWRASPPPLVCSPEDFEECVPALLRAGAGGLGWWRVRGSDLRDSPGALRLRDVHRRQVVEQALREAAIVHVIETLRAAGVEAIVVKGWAVARLYPEPGLRASGDLDLIIPPDQVEAAYAAVEGWESGRQTFDLSYQDYPKLRDRTLDDLYARSTLVPLEDGMVRVVGPEDQLGIIALHFLRHGGYRPLWLCDIALCVERAGTGFDWDTCLGDDQLVRNWITCAVGLAHEVLGAHIDHVPDESVHRLPSWLVPALQKEWKRVLAGGNPELRMPLASAARHPRYLPKALRNRWWGPIRVTIWADRPFDESSRLPMHLRNLAWRAGAYGARRVRGGTAAKDLS